jgi:hypothetical protein
MKCNNFLKKIIKQKTLGLLSLSLLSLYPLTSALAKEKEIPFDISLVKKPNTIKVLIAENQENCVLEAKGGYRLYNPITHYSFTN